MGDEEVQLGEGPYEKMVTIMTSFMVERNTVEPTIHDGPVLFRELEKYSLDSKPKGGKPLLSSLVSPLDQQKCRVL